MKSDDEELLKSVKLSEASPPPWAGDNANPAAVDHLKKEIFGLLDDHSRLLPPLTRDQATVVAMLMAKAATWGWDAAMHNGPMAQRNAAPAAAEAKRAQRTERYAAIRAAFERFAAAGREPDIDQLAAEFSVSRPTVYRALRRTE